MEQARSISLISSSRGLYAPQLLQQYFVVVAVGRQEMDILSAGLGGLYQLAQFAKGRALLHSCCRGHVANAVDGAVPNDVVDVNIVAKEVFGIIVNVDYSGEAVALCTEEIEEAAILAEGVAVVGIVSRALVVAQDDDESAAHLVGQGLAAHDVNIFAKHKAKILNGCVERQSYYFFSESRKYVL